MYPTCVRLAVVIVFAFAARTDRLTADDPPVKPAVLAHAADIRKRVDADYPMLDSLYKHIHSHPELSLQEEQTAARLAKELRAAGFEVTLVGRTPERPNLVARLRGAAEGPVLGLLSHVDTVLADPGEWSRDPWSGDLVDGEVWGRGAQDMKSQTAAEAAAALDLAASGWRPARGDLLVIVVVDEEILEERSERTARMTDVHFEDPQLRGRRDRHFGEQPVEVGLVGKLREAVAGPGGFQRKLSDHPFRAERGQPGEGDRGGVRCAGV